MALSTLTAIRTKVRRLTRSLTVNRLSDADIDEYVNTFIQYDFPEHLRLFSLRETVTWYTKPFVDTYTSNTILNDPLEDFKDRYTTIHPPVFIDGCQVGFTQSRNEFFGWYPQNRSDQIVAVGDGITLTFNGILPTTPLLRNLVTFTSINTFNTGLLLQDVPFNSSSGNLVVPNNPAGLVLDPNNTINYITGAFTITFPSAPAAQTNIVAHIYPFTPSKPLAILYFDDSFIVRPVPDQVYPVQIEVYKRPTELLAANVGPELEQWWQYIAYGASKKVLEDRGDMDTIALIMPEYKQQERLVLRRTIVQQTNERVATIYTDQVNQGVGPFGNQGF